jgi:NPCBM/NEW2 domain
MADDGQTKKWSLILVLIAAVLGIPTGVIVNSLSGSHSAQAQSTESGAPPSASTSPALPSRTPQASQSPEASETAQAKTSPTPTFSAPPQTAYLSQMNIVGFDYASSTGTNDQGSYSIDGTTYGHSVMLNPGCQNGDGGDFWIEYNLGKSWSLLTATVGASENDADDAAFSYTVYGDGRVLTSGHATLSQPKSLHVNVSGYLRLRLLISDPASTNRECGFSNGPHDYVWGNAMLTQ